MVFSDSDSSGGIGDVDNVSLSVQGEPVGGTLDPHGPLTPSQGCSQVNFGASTSSAGGFVGFPVAPDQHGVVGRSLGAAFNVVDATGALVTEVSAMNTWVSLRKAPDGRKAYLLAGPWTIPSNINELRVLDSDSHALSTRPSESETVVQAGANQLFAWQGILYSH